MNKKQVLGAAGLAGATAISMAVSGGQAYAGASGAVINLLPSLTSTVSSVSVGTAGTFVTALAANPLRKNCTVLIPSTLGLAYVYVGSGTAGSGGSYSVNAAGSGNASWTCAVSGVGVITDQISVTTATAGSVGVIAQ